MLQIDLTDLSFVMAGAVAYYTLLFVCSFGRCRPEALHRRLWPIRPSVCVWVRRRPSWDVGVRFALEIGRARKPVRKPMIVLVVPAHNEELVVERTIESLVGLDYAHTLVLIMNDGSTDSTGERARRCRDARVIVVDRPAAIAGRGKGAVLNHAFALLLSLAHAGDARLQGRTAEEIIVGVVDADGQLERQALAEVAPYFADQRVGGVQIGVRIANAADGLLPRLQDMEFVGFSHLVQVARDRLGSVGLGGNGQFTRLSALSSLGCEPWSGCLTEDLDLGLSLVKRGWRIRFCPSAFVAQQGLTRWRPLLRQRARWVQGHYQCWRHLPGIIGSRRARLSTRIDLVVYLLMIIFVLLVFANVVLSVLGIAGVIAVENHVADFVPDGAGRRALLLLFSIGPLAAFTFAYQRKSAAPYRGWELPAHMAAFALYAYAFVISQLWAFGRIVLRRGSWAKTPRVAAKTAV